MLNYASSRVVLPFRCIGSGVGAGPHERLDSLEEIGFGDVAPAALIDQQEFHQLHCKRYGHVVKPVLHGLKTHDGKKPFTSIDLFHSRHYPHLSQMYIILLHVDKVVSNEELHSFDVVFVFIPALNQASASAAE